MVKGQQQDEDRVRIVHSLVLSRLYHEDLLLTQRTYNFLTFNVFLGALLVLASSSNGYAFGILWFLFAILGISVACLQIAFGRRIERAIGFWREYLKLLERASGLPVDHVLFEFYKTAKIDTEWGRIIAKGKNKRAMYSTFPWSRMPSTNTMIGVLLPWVVATLWFGVLAVPLWLGKSYLQAGLALAVWILLAFFTWVWPLPGRSEGENPPAEKSS